MSQDTKTLYQIADAEIRRCIDAYLTLMKETKGLSDIQPTDLEDDRCRGIVLAGIGAQNHDASPEQACEEWRRRQAIPFDLETAISYGVYGNIRHSGADFLDQVERATDGFRSLESDFIHDNPHFLPILQHLGGVFSKAALKKHVGAVSDTAISGPASVRLAALLKDRVEPTAVNKGEILQRLESTLEGIVRDLVGRVLLESIVESALNKDQVPFQREHEYSSLTGVVYDFRADFVLPHSSKPQAFIEVRKSSSRHASLYAKDKMFSAINWKGCNTDILAILVVDGEWTQQTLRVMAKVFDYVIPIGRVPELVTTVKAYLDGDRSKLKWLIEFRITDAQATP